MSWVEKIQRELIITTGDGKEYKPNWLNASKDVEYNVAQFNFPKIPGTLVAGGEPKGAQYSVEFYFQGEDHLDKFTAFEQSAKDKRPWTISHPFYGRLVVKPLALKFDHSKYNV